MATQSTLTSADNLGDLQSTADRARDLTLNAMYELTRTLLQSPSVSSLISSHATANSRSLTIGRTDINVHNICRNARLYRLDLDHFDQLATPVPHTDESEWKCNHCGALVSNVSLRLSAGSDDQIWIGPVGFFKAHCEHRLGETTGWTCIWPVASPSCNSHFNTERRLLEHMRDHHVSIGTVGGESQIDWSADFHYQDIRFCGFGAEIRGQAMESAEGGFMIPAPVS